MKKILIMGLPGAGKTTLSKELAKRLNAVHLNADEIRTEINKDCGFSIDGRIEHARRMGVLADIVTRSGSYCIADFVCPTLETRQAFGECFMIFVDRISAGRFEDTNKMFVRPESANVVVTADGTAANWSHRIAGILRPTFDPKNKFEVIIASMMNEEVLTKKPQLKEILGRAFKNKFEKRQAILSVLDTDRQLFTKINRKIGERPRLEIVTEIVEMLRQYVKVGETERKLYGEVMTPISLVDEMLDQLPEEVWTNPDLKWLDPANGCGIFPAVIVQRLMKGLAGKIPDEEERYKHIVEKMLHVCELQPKNMFLFLCAFDPKDKYAMNIFTGSFLTEDFNRHAKELWNVEKFDVIVGNPPFQKESPNRNQTHPLWNLFVKTALTILKTEGYLTIIHPSGWRNISGKFKDVQTEIRTRQLLNLSIHDETEGMTNLGAETRYDFYTLRNKKNHAIPTKIHFGNGKTLNMELSQLEFIPNDEFETIARLIAKKDEPRVSIIADCAYHHQLGHVSPIKTDQFKYPCVYTVKSGDQLSLKWSSNNTKGHFGIPKLIWSNFRISSAGSFIDLNGEFGLTQFAYALADKPEVLPVIKRAFDSPRFRALMEAVAVGELSINRKIIALFRRDFWKEFIND